MRNDDEGLPSIILAGRGLLVKMLTSLEPHVYFNQICIRIHFNIIETQVCKTVIKLFQAICLG